jgi:hypothetical protein
MPSIISNHSPIINQQPIVSQSIIAQTSAHTQSIISHQPPTINHDVNVHG